MILHEAMHKAREKKCALGHPRLNNKKWFMPLELEEMAIPTMITVSNDWEVQPRVIYVKENHFRKVCITVLRKYIEGPKIDDVIDDLQKAIFKDGNFTT